MIEPPTEPLSRADESVRTFLAERDAPCPGCNYNLRGVEQPVCPECGRGIELSISRPGRSRGYLLFVLLALGWVLIAGTMNGARAWKVVQQEATLSRWGGLTRTFGTVNPGQVRLVVPSVGSGSTTLTLPPTRTTSRGMVTITSGSVSFSTTGTPAMTPGTGYNWSAVSSQSWAMLSWWGGLGVLALICVILCIVRRRRFDGERPPRPLVASAGILFALYATYHAVMFTREMMT